MKKRNISNLFIFSIVMCLFVLLLSRFTDTAWTYGEVWNQETVEAVPFQIKHPQEDVTEYYFRQEDLAGNGNMLMVYTAHHNMCAYRDSILEENLIYAHVSTESFIGRTNGTVPNFIEIPADAERIIVVSQAIYAEYFGKYLTFIQGNAVGILLGNLRSSSIESNMSSVLILLGLALFAYWAVMSRKLQLDKSVLYFSIFSTLLGLWTFNETTLSKLLFSDRTLCSFMGYFLLLMIPQPYILFAKTFLKLKDEMIYKVLCVICTVVIICTFLLHTTSIVEYREMAFVVHICLVLGISYMVYGLVSRIHMVGFDRRVIVNLLGAILLALTTLIDLAAYYSGRHNTDVLGRFGMLLYIVILATEVMSEFTHQMEENRKMKFYKELALVDSLTGSYNNNAFCHWQNTKDSKLQDALVVCDLNDLKKCNDTYGHLTGDQYIIEAAQLITEAFDKIGTCYRVGGDEFCVVVLAEHTDRIERCIQNLQKLQEEYNKKSDKINMQIACGYAVYESTDQDINAVLARADIMMYENKQEIKKIE